MKRQSISLGIIKNSAGQVLIAKRHKGKHLEGFWEFPGGKVEINESFKLALRRELYEEVGISIGATRKIIDFEYQYEDRLLHFLVFQIINYQGELKSKEEQQLKWVNVADLETYRMPLANQAILNAIKLPINYMIADAGVLKENLLKNVNVQLKAGISIVQYRDKQANKSTYVGNAKVLRKLCNEYNAKLISNCALDWTDEIIPHGIHLNSQFLKEIMNNCDQSNYFSASCHNVEEIKIANELRLQCVLIGAVKVTKSHPHLEGLGWNNFSRLCDQSNYPAYALGGLTSSDLEISKVYGAQGIAGIRLYRL